MWRKWKLTNLCCKQYQLVTSTYSKISASENHNHPFLGKTAAFLKSENKMILGAFFYYKILNHYSTINFSKRNKLNNIFSIKFCTNATHWKVFLECEIGKYFDKFRVAIITIDLHTKTGKFDDLKRKNINIKWVKVCAKCVSFVEFCYELKSEMA